MGVSFKRSNFISLITSTLLVGQSSLSLFQQSVIIDSDRAYAIFQIYTHPPENGGIKCKSGGRVSFYREDTLPEG